jgi:hypothetical protein
LLEILILSHDNTKRVRIHAMGFYFNRNQVVASGSSIDMFVVKIITAIILYRGTLQTLYHP